MHPMRQAKRRIENREEVERLLLEAEYFTLTINDENGAPYAVPLNFGYRDNVLYFHCANEGRKLDLLRADPRVGFCAVVWAEVHGVNKPNACVATCSYASVMGAGRARELETPEEKVAALKLLMEHYSDRDYEYPDDVVARTCVVAVDVEWLDAKLKDVREQ